MTADDRAPGAEALLLAIADALPDRVEPRCPHFGRCGGCQLQHLPYPAQLSAKRDMLVAMLQQAGLRVVPEVHLHAADPWQYRNRARMRVEDGRFGYSVRASNDFLPVRECPIVSPMVWNIAHTLQAMVAAGEARWPAGTRAFEVFANGDESAAQLSLHLQATVATVDRDAPPDFRRLCEAVQRSVPELAGAGLLVSANPDPAQPQRVQKSSRVEIARWGEAALLYRVESTAYTVTRNAFFQVNRYLADLMVRLVTEGRSGGLAYDLFAGAGLFSVPLARHFTRVVAVEIGEPAASDLATHLRLCGSQHRAMRSTAHDFLLKAGKGATPDLVVLDPPRAGLGRKTAQVLAALRAPEIVYVSCDAETFAADSRTLLESGYTLHHLHLLDLFPQTFHTETIAVFRR